MIYDFRFTIWQAASVLPGVSGVLETRLRKLAHGVSRLVRLPGIAPGHAPWQGAILLLNHNREIKRAGSVITPPARAISIKNKHLLVVYSTPTRGFTAAVSVFMGTPPAKPLNCKLGSNHFGALFGGVWTHSTG